MKLGVIANPLSQQNKGGLTGLETVIRDVPDLHYRPLEAFDSLPEVLRDLAAQEVGALIICAGDGTVQACLTEMVESRPFEVPPLLGVVPCGMTNMIAQDVGLRGSPPKALRRVATLLLGGETNPHIRQRRLLRLENAAGFPPQIGMFFGGAAIHRAIQICRAKVHRLKFEAELANGLTLAALLLRWCLRGRRPDDVLHGDRIRIALDGAAPVERDCLVVMASTLEKLTLNSRPFWNRGDGDFYLTSVDYPPPALFRSLPRFLRGGEDRDLPAGYHSNGAKRAELAMDCPFTLDGQLFEPTAGKPVVLTAPATANFICA